jgi:hypothetical protein
MRTDDTLSRGALVSIRLDAEPLVVVEVGLAAALSGVSRVPLTSMRWPTWFFRSLSRPSSTYETGAVEPAVVAPVVPVVPAVVGDEVVPAVVLADPLPVVAFARM